ncbi:MAG TPA: CoA pyrophosphatase [Spirochaetia bacterium]|nr:CoA pyrophosphatase [Spirochaetia bacterium]
MKRDLLDEIKDKLPKTPGIHGKDEYFNSAVLVLLVPIGGEYHFLFEKRASAIRQGGEICFPGGEYDEKQDADFQETAVRETAEELGITADKLDIIGVLDTMVAPMGTTVDAFVGVARIGNLKELKVNPLEVESIFTVPVSYFLHTLPEGYEVDIEIHPSYFDEETGKEVVLLPARELGLPAKYTEPWHGRRHNILVYRTEKGVIWGITARLVYDLARKITDREIDG